MHGRGDLAVAFTLYSKNLKGNHTYKIIDVSQLFVEDAPTEKSKDLVLSPLSALIFGPVRSPMH